MERINIEKTSLGQSEFDASRARDTSYTGDVLKWSEREIRREFEAQDDHIRPNLNKVRKFQRHTDSLEECVRWSINSIKNDIAYKNRCLDHGTGAV